MKSFYQLSPTDTATVSDTVRDLRHTLRRAGGGTASFLLNTLAKVAREDGEDAKADGQRESS